MTCTAESERNVSIVRRLFEHQFSDAGLGVVDEALAADHVDHSPLPLTVPGREGYKLRLQSMRAAFSDIRFVIEDILGEGDRVAVRFSFSGRHTGTFRGVGPTGRQVTIRGINIERLSGGRIVEHWGAFDVWDVMRQIEAV